MDDVDGEIEDRDVGERRHLSVQKFFGVRMSGPRACMGVRVFPEDRVSRMQENLDQHIRLRVGAKCAPDPVETRVPLGGEIL